jgi:Dynamin GTPase effector domain
MFQRIIDDLPRTINHAFLKSLSVDLQTTLMSHLGAGSRDPVARAKSYFEESVEETKKRAELNRDREILEKVLEELNRFDY